MPSTIQRPVFFEGQILGAADLQQAMRYGRQQDARHERYLHTWGIAEGLEIQKRGDEFVVAEGLAIDSSGAPIVVAEPIRLDAEQLYDEALISRDDHEKLFPVFVVRTENRRPSAGIGGRCGANASSRTSEGATVRFRPFATDWDQQTMPGVDDLPDDREESSLIVLVGFVQWEAVDGLPKGRIADTTLRDDPAGIGPRYAGVAADEVIGRAGRLTLGARHPKTQDAPTVVIGDYESANEPRALTLGLDNGHGSINDLLTVDPKGNVEIKGNFKAAGTIEGRLQKGDVAIESGIAGDGVTLPLPPGITQEQVAAGDVVLHPSITPRVDRLVDPAVIGATDMPLFIECSLDAAFKVRCTVRWMSFASAVMTEVGVYPGSVDYILIAYVNAGA